MEAKQKYRGMCETQKSENKTGDSGLNIRTNTIPKMGQDQERVLLKVVSLDIVVDVNVDFTTKVMHTLTTETL